MISLSLLKDVIEVIESLLDDDDDNGSARERTGEILEMLKNEAAERTIQRESIEWYLRGF